MKAALRQETMKRYPGNEKELAQIEQYILKLLISVRYLADTIQGLKDTVESTESVVELFHTLCGTYDPEIRERASYLLCVLSIIPPKYFGIPQLLTALDMYGITIKMNKFPILI